MNDMIIAIINGVFAFICMIASIVIMSKGKDAHDLWTATWGLLILFNMYTINYQNKVNNK